VTYEPFAFGDSTPRGDIWPWRSPVIFAGPRDASGWPASHRRMAELLRTAARVPGFIILCASRVRLIGVSRIRKVQKELRRRLR
jgi:hypothetical protein